MSRVLHVSIARFRPDLPGPDEELGFVVSIHEQGSGIAWQQNVTVGKATEKFLVDVADQLFLWSTKKALVLSEAYGQMKALGDCLYKAFIGREGEKVLESIEPTAVLFNVDETLLGLPWELIGMASRKFALDGMPFGRLVTTRVLLRQKRRNPPKKDRTVRILAVVNPTSDLGDAESRNIAALHGLKGRNGRFCVEVDLLAREQATLASFKERLAHGDYDMLHFGGHGFLDRDQPGSSALRFKDGRLHADEVLELPWKQAPYFVFNSACESARAAGGRRLASNSGQANGLAAAFLAAGASSYAGYFWPVSDVGSSLFAKAFYKALFDQENVGLAFMAARRCAIQELSAIGDFAGFSAVLFGDAASAHRRADAFAS